MKYRITTKTKEEFSTLKFLASCRASEINEDKLFMVIEPRNDKELNLLKAYEPYGWTVEEYVNLSK